MLLKDIANQLKCQVDLCETERGDGSALPKDAGFPAGDISRAMYWQCVLANATYFCHYPNPTHNPVIKQLCAQLDTVNTRNDLMREGNLLGHFSSGKTFLPRSKRNMNAHYAKPLVEIIEEQLEALFANTSFTQQQCDEADAVAAAMKDELLFYDQLRAQAEQQAQLGDNRFMLEAFRKLIPIWVAKQDCYKVWQPFPGNNNSNAKPVTLDAKFAPNLFGSRFFDAERWWGCRPDEAWDEDEDHVNAATEPINALIDLVANGSMANDSPNRKRFKMRMAANLTRYVILTEAAAEQGGPFIPSFKVDDPRNGSIIEARDLFAKLSVRDLYESFDPSLFPDAVKRKANLVFGVYLAPVVGIANCEELPFTFDGENRSDGGTIEATRCTPRSEDDGVALGVGAASAIITVSHKLTGAPFATSKVIEFPAAKNNTAGSELLCIVGRYYDSSKWEALRDALSNVARMYFGADANGVSYVKQFVDQEIGTLFNDRWIPLIRQLVDDKCFPANSGASLDFEGLRNGFEEAIQCFCDNEEVQAADNAPTANELRGRLVDGSSSLASRLEAQELECLRELAKETGWTTGETRLSQVRVEDAYDSLDDNAMNLAQAIISGKNSINVMVGAHSYNVLKSHLLEQVRTCAEESIPSAFGKTGKRLYTPVIMDFLTCGVLEWATGKSEQRTLKWLETCLSKAFDCFIAFERSITLECWPDDTDAGEEEARHLSAISSRHLAFFLDQNNQHRFSVTCLDAKNGAVVYAANQTGAQLCLSHRDKNSMNGLHKRAHIFENQSVESFTKAYDKVIALSLDDSIDIPAYEGMTVQIVG